MANIMGMLLRACLPRESRESLSVDCVQVLLKVYKALGTDKDYVAFSQRFKAAHPGYRPGECSTGGLDTRAGCHITLSPPRWPCISLR